MPHSAICTISAVPPEEKNGSEMPVDGRVFVTTATLSSTCTASSVVRPKAIRVANRVGACIAIQKPRRISSAKSSRISTAPIKPNSSQIMEKM